MTEKDKGGRKFGWSILGYSAALRKLWPGCQWILEPKSSIKGNQLPQQQACISMSTTLSYWVRVAMEIWPSPKHAIGFRDCSWSPWLIILSAVRDLGGTFSWPSHIHILKICTCISEFVLFIHSLLMLPITVEVENYSKFNYQNRTREFSTPCHTITLIHFSVCFFYFLIISRVKNHRKNGIYSCFYIKRRHFPQNAPLRKTKKVPVPRLYQLGCSSHGIDSSHYLSSLANAICSSKGKNLFTKRLHRKMYKEWSSSVLRVMKFLVLCLWSDWCLLPVIFVLWLQFKIARYLTSYGRNLRTFKMYEKYS